MGETEAERLKLALQWLRSHQRRLMLDRRSLEEKLAAVAAEIERITGEIERAEERLRALARPVGEGAPREGEL